MIICQQIWKTQHWPQNWKGSIFIPIPKKGNARECSNYCTIVLISHISKVMLKILQDRLQQYMTCELPDVQAGFQKAEELEIKLPTSVGSLKKQENSRKTPAAANSLQSCPTLCDPIDGSPLGSPVPGILQARTLEWVATSFLKVKSKSEVAQSCPTLGDPMDHSLPGPWVHGIFQARGLQ